MWGCGGVRVREREVLLESSWIEEPGLEIYIYIYIYIGSLLSSEGLSCLLHRKL